jgi:hypothetical protein
VDGLWTGGRGSHLKNLRRVRSGLLSIDKTQGPQASRTASTPRTQVASTQLTQLDPRPSADIYIFLNRTLSVGLFHIDRP